MADGLDVGSVVLKINADASGIKAGFEAAEKGAAHMRIVIEQAGGAVEQANKGMAASAQDGGAAQAAAYAAIAAAATKAFQIIVNAIDTGINASERYKAAMIGLNSVAQGAGVGGDTLQAELNKVVDAFFDASAAATSYKNLLSRGYSLEQATRSIMRLKDAAAFGRQGQLSLAEAVQTATEGLRNENSILVDNSGVTKNVSVMWKEYAQSIGTSVDKLTQSQKVEAEYQGIMRETQHQVGDLAKASATLAGEQAKSANNTLLLSQAYGESMTPAVSLLTQAQNELLESLTGVVNTFPGVAAGATSAGLAFAGFMVVSKAAQALKAFNATLTAAGTSMKIFGMSASAAMPIVGAISIALGLAVSAWTSYKQGQEKAAQAAEAQAQKEREHVKAMRETVDGLTSLKGRYEELSKKTNRTYQDNQDLMDIQRQLKEQYGINVGALDSLGEAYKRITGLIDEKIAASERELQIDREKAAMQANTAMHEAKKAADEARGIAQEVEGIRTLIAERERLNDAMDSAQGDDVNTYWTRIMDLNNQIEGMTAKLAVKGYDAGEFKLDELFDELQRIIAAEGPAVVANAKEQMRAVAGALAGEGLDLGGTEAITGLFENLISADPSQDVAALVSAYENALRNVDIGPAVKTMREINAKILSGATPTDADMTAIEDSWDTISGFVMSVYKEGTIGFGEFGSTLAYLAPVMGSLVSQGAMAPKLLMDAWKAASAELLQTEAGFESFAGSAREHMDTLEKAGEALGKNNKIIEGMTLLRDSMTEGSTITKEAVDIVIAEFERMGITVPQTLDDAQIALNDYTATQANAANEWQTATQQAAQDYISLGIAIENMKATGGDPAEIARLEALRAELNQTNVAAQELADAKITLDVDDISLTKFHSGLESAEDASARLQKVLDKTAKEAQDLNKKLNEKTNLAEKLTDIQQISQAMMDGTASAEEMAQAEQYAATYLGLIGANASEMNTAATFALDNVQAELNQLGIDATNAANLIAKITQVAASTPSLNLNVSPAISAIQALSSVWNTFANSFLGRLFGLKPIGTVNNNGGGGGGGGSSTPQGKSAFEKAIDTLKHNVNMGKRTLEQELAELEKLKAKYYKTLSLEDRRSLNEEIRRVEQSIRKKNLNDDLALIDYKKSMNQMSAAQEIAALEAVKNKHRLTTDEKREIEVRLHELRKQQKQDAYEWDMALLNHSVAMGELNTAQEIARLQELKAKHTISAEERMAIDERIYALQQKLADEAAAAEEERINNASEGVKKAYTAIVAALKKRYQQEKDLQTKHIDEQIKALDDLTKAENEQKHQSDYAASLADKQRELSVEKSARRRRELLAEIAKMEADEELRLRQADRNEEKERLQAEKQAIQDRYVEITSEENLRQEALRLVMSKNLDEMTDLIASYGNEWKDAGAQLAEYLTQGITGGSVIEALTSLNQRIQDSINQQLKNIGNSIPNITAAGSTSVVIQMDGITIREDADIHALARELQRLIDAEKR